MTANVLGFIGQGGVQQGTRSGVQPPSPDFTGAVHRHGATYWFEKGVLHRDNDLPAIEFACGSSWWLVHGKRHRDGDKPAAVHADGHKEWWLHGVLRREGDLPSVVGADDSQQWLVGRQLHRDGDRPAVVRTDGTQEWWAHGKRHREGDAPAVVRGDGTHEWWAHGARHRAAHLPAIVQGDGTREWWVHGQLHRDDGDKPAVERVLPDKGGRETEWWLHGKRQRVRYGQPCDAPVCIRATGTLEWWGPHPKTGADCILRTMAVSAKDGEIRWLNADGMLHCDEDDGPAVLTPAGVHEYWQHGALLWSTVVTSAFKPDNLRFEFVRALVLQLPPSFATHLQQQCGYLAAALRHPAICAQYAACLNDTGMPMPLRLATEYGVLIALFLGHPEGQLPPTKRKEKKAKPAVVLRRGLSMRARAPAPVPVPEPEPEPEPMFMRAPAAAVAPATKRSWFDFLSGRV